MMDQLNIVKVLLIKLLTELTEEWESMEVIIEAPPTSNKGLVTLPKFWDRNGNKKIIFLRFDPKSADLIFDLIREMNKDDNKLNQIFFKANRENYSNASIEVTFNPQIEDNFQNSLPKSKRGKTIPWYKM